MSAMRLPQLEMPVMPMAIVLLVTPTQTTALLQTPWMTITCMRMTMLLSPYPLVIMRTM
jgi:hypothetical protein